MAEKSSGNSIFGFIAISMLVLGIFISKLQGTGVASVDRNVGEYASKKGAITTVEALDDASATSWIGSKYSVRESEFIKLCNLVLREAGNGQVEQWEAACVVETVMNRVYSEEFPGTIQGVISQPKQYDGYLPSLSYNEDVNYYVKDTVIGYLNGDFHNHGMFYYWGDALHNYFFETYPAFEETYYTIYQKSGVKPADIINYRWCHSKSKTP